MDYFDGITLAALEIGGLAMLFVLTLLMVSCLAMILFPIVVGVQAAVRFAVRQIRKRALA